MRAGLLQIVMTTCCCFSCSSMAGNDADVATQPGKRYTYKGSAGSSQQLEIYFPENHDPSIHKVPGLILFHGGGWTGGSLNQFRAAAQYFASRGLVAATANYRMLSRTEAARLSPEESRKRVCITDAKSAIRWMKQNADKLGIDPHKVISGGGSAGGHVSVLATTNPNIDDPLDPQGIDTSVVAYLLFNPAFSPDDEADPEVNVLLHVHADFPPAVVFFGTEDEWRDGWEAVNAKLRRLGNENIEIWTAENQHHGFFNKQPWRDLTLVAADRFLVRHGLLKGQPKIPAGSQGGEQLIKAEHF
jgi:acetyl esterase